MIPEPLFRKHLTWQNRAVFFKIRLTPATGFAILQTYLFLNASFLGEDASESNSTYSSAMPGKLINISIPAILWSFDTICVSTSSGLR